MVNKNNDDDVIIVQCKNYKDKKVCIGDLFGIIYIFLFIRSFDIL